MALMINLDSLLLETFSKAIGRCGFDEFCFMVIAKDNAANVKLPSLNNIGMSSIKRQQYVVASSQLALNVRANYFRHYGHYDERITARKMKLGPVVWMGIDRGKRTGACIEGIFDRYGIQTVVTWTVELHGNLAGGFTLMSGKEKSEILKLIKESKEEMELNLKLFGGYVVQQHLNELNPVQNFKSLSPKSISVLSLLSKGYDVDSIAQLLYITNRGVCYHIDKLKASFDSRSRYELISKATQLGLV